MSLLGDIKDVGSAVFEIGKAAKGLIGNADILAGGLKGLGSLFQRFSTVGRLSDLARLGRKLSEYGDDALRFLANPEIKRFLKRAKTPILVGGQTTIAGMKLTTGVGSPDGGERFADGASRFTDAGDTLAGAYPNGSWTGSGSESYANKNSRQVGRTQTMAASDRSINSVLAREAGQITAARTALDEQSDWLADVGLVTMLVAATPYVGQGASLAMEIAAVTKALGACSMQLTELTQQVNANAAEIQQAAGQYSRKSGMSNMSRTTPDPKPPSPGGENGDEPADTDNPADEPGPDGTQPSPESTRTEDAGPDGSGRGSGSGSGTGSGSSGGSPSGDAASGDASATPETPEIPETVVPPSPSPTASPASGGGGLGSLASPLSSLPAAAAGAMPTAGTAGLSAAQITSLVQSAVQRAMQEQAEKAKAEEEADKAREDTDGDGIPDVDEDENGDGVPDVDQNIEQEQNIEQDTEDDAAPDEAGAAPGARDGGRAPVGFAADVDPAQTRQPDRSYFGAE